MRVDRGGSTRTALVESAQTTSPTQVPATAPPGEPVDAFSGVSAAAQLGGAVSPQERVRLETWTGIADLMIDGQVPHARREQLLAIALNDPAIYQRLQSGAPPTTREAMLLGQAMTQAFTSGAIGAETFGAGFGVRVSSMPSMERKLRSLPAPERTEATAYWQDAMYRRGLVATPLVKSLSEPDGILGRAITAAGVRPEHGTNYRPGVGDVHATSAADERNAFIPMVLYEVDAQQLETLRGFFPLETRNLLSAALGQKENRGLVIASDPNNDGRRTLWRMAVYPVEGDASRFRVGFYGETLPNWATGSGMVHVGGVDVGYRVGADTEVGKDVPPHVRLIDELLRLNGVMTR